MRGTCLERCIHANGHEHHAPPAGARAPKTQRREGQREDQRMIEERERRDNRSVTVQLTELQEQTTKLGTSREIIGVLRFLWDKIVHPIISQLDNAGVPHRSRIWWCLTSELCSLPLHAAGPYRGGERNLPDLYTSSYTPTLSALIRARSNIIRRKAPTLLVVGHPDDALQHVGEEVKIIQQLSDSAKVIIGKEATRDAVLQGLREHPWVHFACHGNLGDDLQPFQASFQLHDRRLPLLDIIRARLPNAELAFLSACFSAAGDVFTPDETIHLAAALQFCGFRSVVGTLWEMNDEDGPFISKEFYKYMFRDSGKRPDFKDSAEGLSYAIREMRKDQVPVERWVMFVHIGA
ncbi:hypothetical protein JR316_0012798 [Psilocybe cubensis]|uniref:CHAT domain-containing protein n=2 Tax=Psilocybe cubensis TaxID=181762 RepID=A0A8H8CGI1_PSICU|nr:hypothetical protein JR316_0012798 [Psilocybe cubensis]KAH9474340.1 hypothetical protein JR316_0012798 [Psilocybe cubensis]